MLEILGIVICVLLLGFMCMKGIHSLVAGLVCSALLLIFNGANIYEGITGTYMSGFVSFVSNWFLMFLFGGLLGQILDVSGAADSLAQFLLNLVGAKNITLGLFLVGLIFTAAGITPYVTLFIVFPIGVKMCKRADLPRIFSIAGFQLGETVGLALPYAPVANNIVCTKYFGTEASAGGIWALIVCVIFSVLGILYLAWYEKYLIGHGTRFISLPDETIEDENQSADKPHWIIGLIPLLVPIVTLNFLKWSVEYSLLAGAVVACVLLFKHIPKTSESIREMIGKVINNSTVTVINTSAVVGFGAVVTASAAYDVAVAKILSIEANPLIMAFACTGLLAGVAGSAASGIVLAAPVLQQFLTQTNASLIHRATIFASLTLDTLPISGFLHTKAAVSGVPLKDSYIKMDLVVTVILPIVSGLIYILGCFVMGLA